MSDPQLSGAKPETVNIRILIIDDEAPIREVLSATLKDEGYQVQTAHDGESGLRMLREFHPQIVFLDIWMPGSIDGIEVLTRARQDMSSIDFVMISGHGTIETAVKATKLGAWDFIEKPLSMDKILIGITNILHYQQERQEKELLLTRLRKNIALIGETQPIISLKQLVARVAPTQSWILLQGENGCGKQLTAQNIHYLSSRASRPFVEMTCANLAEDLIETELFGYEKGAFAGALRTQKGKIELANGGTLYLDDISDLSARAQEKLLRVLQERKIQRLGGGEFINVDVRVIAGTEKDLSREIQEGRFREDLYHRVSVVTLKIPALREHREDVPALVQHFSDQIAKEGGFSLKEFSERAMEAMKQHIWPGNVRELKNFVERIYILTPGDFVDLHDLRFAGLAMDLPSEQPNDRLNFRDARALFEKDYLVRKIAENSGNISRTAEAIGLERSYLHRKIKAYGIDAHKDEEAAANDPLGTLGERALK
ncbi:MAG: Fis family transcriptional regulator [Bdellovibrio sp.]|nr:MAG: Fis family transcriptional regulator [Bdellovibrio sp.]